MSLVLPLAIQSSGQGDDLVLLHGWGMNNAVWGDDFIAALSEDFRVHRVELPGHGESVYAGEKNVAEVSARLGHSLQHHQIVSAHFCGWSLGGMVAQHFLHQQPERFRSLTLIASTARFVQAPDWQHAMDASVLTMFANTLQQDYRATLQRFLALQTLGSAQANQSLRLLRERVFARGEPAQDGLSTGLNILRHFDMREAFGAIKLPVSVLAGERDTLVPIQALKAMQGLNPYIQIHSFPGAGHAPFISQASEVIDQIKVFCHAG